MTIPLEFLVEEGYSDLVEIPSRGLCGLRRMIFTTALCYNLSEIGYDGRYCFHSNLEAQVALASWNGFGDPPGNWIKHKGEMEYPNPNYNKE